MATDIRASVGHSWNQSIQVQLTRAGNFLPLTRKVLPTGEKQRITFNCFLTLSIKNFQQFSLVSCNPAPLTSFLTIVTIFSTSSSPNRSGISPEANKLLINTRNFSSATCASVIRKTVPKFFKPAFWYKFARSCFKSVMPYPFLSVTCKKIFTISESKYNRTKSF